MHVDEICMLHAYLHVCICNTCGFFFFARMSCVPSKVFFTTKHLTVFGLFRIALSKRRAEKNKKKKYLQIPAKSDNFRQDLLSNKL